MTTPSVPLSAAPARLIGPRDVSIDYLRVTATLLVLVAHCCMPYMATAHLFGPASWQSPIPIQDSRHSRLCEALFYLLDASDISLWFFISGLFTYGSLRKRGVRPFLRERFFRLGLPFVAMTLLLMPLAYYPVWRLEHPGASLGRFWLADAQAHFITGPGWFLWVLLLFDTLLAAGYALCGGLVPRLAPLIRWLGRRPLFFFLLTLVAGIVAYVPLYLRYGDTWLPMGMPPFMMQRARVLFYALSLLAGFLVGSVGIDDGLVARDGRLARAWPGWLAAGLVAGNLRWFATYSAGLAAKGDVVRAAVLAMLWVVSNLGMVFGLLALFRGIGVERRGWADSLSRHAYAIYAFHYIFALWMERLMLGAAVPGYVKAVSCLGVTLGLSWVTAIAWGQIWQWLVPRRMGAAVPERALREA